ncbi:hypothetical protein [Alicyclobacillus macrosporangiidus]|uniref:Permuted papain-like amidase enzyme, YaeF/YiiX, C92 family n=1 Tax=Alicyclobacillus macrosporangiidus TaxID=392015 RepID=A0A1I7IEP7_9BACL|nr:hypothetical protein [Alicyclobacillus macrosporangiidus]SFU71405.1 hypothetical protein SAMN05421543_106176 [Alicyclobacillus macrosporangiidus]
MVPGIQPGDVLLFRDGTGLLERGIDFFETLEDGPQPVMYHHAAIALGDHAKIEALLRVEITALADTGNFDVFRPPVDIGRRREALRALRSLQGQRYDYLLILDDALRYATRGVIHLPRRWVESWERRRKICSSLVAYYLRKAGFRSKKLRRWPPPSPEDLYLALRHFQVPLDERREAQ